MTIRHHLSEELLMAYAAGELPEAFALVVATHVSLCDECRAQAEAYEALGGAVVEEIAAEMDDAALEACLARLDGMPQMAPARPAPRRRGVLPGPLADYVGGGVEAVKWRPVGKGVRQAILPTDRGATARLLYIPAGVAVPDHGHRGLEMTLVLQGAFADETGRFGPGDVEIADGDLEHVPVAEAGQDCICLAATDAPLRFKGIVPRMAQPFMRI
ncbi:ChrR family anti-sigma-E factor [Rhodobacter sp. Har01]|uniref:ChrR family anti-sigma-E factor n=1 Tax=Rhodobacter sp. Har01 TaxID=2883999 RepID=UPI001D066FFC|nr:ChrR family anti-sigma-E factor [Rhodobacter sp. Har01]MCB6179470.1 ChrR family anti-sigma-E factor [Rhodobacter sp. Har01]